MEKSNKYKLLKAYFHSLGKLNTNLNSGTVTDGQNLYESNRRSGHNINAEDLRLDPINYAADTTAAQAGVGSIYIYKDKVELSPIPGTNGLAWETLDENLISPTDKYNAGNTPSWGYLPTLFDHNDTSISPGAGAWDIDYFSGIIFFDAEHSPYTEGWATMAGDPDNPTGKLKLSYYVYIGRDATDAGGGNTTSLPERTVRVSDDPEVTGENYTNINDAYTYINSQTPSSSNRWTILLYKNIIGVYPRDYIDIVGATDNIVVTNAHGSTGAATFNSSQFYNNINNVCGRIKNCIIKSTILSSGSTYLVFENCKVDLTADIGSASNSITVSCINCEITNSTYPHNQATDTSFHGNYNFYFQDCYTVSNVTIAMGQGTSCVANNCYLPSLSSVAAKEFYVKDSTLGQVDLTGDTYTSETKTVVIENSKINKLYSRDTSAITETFNITISNSLISEIDLEPTTATNLTITFISVTLTTVTHLSSNISSLITVINEYDLSSAPPVTSTEVKWEISKNTSGPEYFTAVENDPFIASGTIVSWEIKIIATRGSDMLIATAEITVDQGGSHGDTVITYTLKDGDLDLEVLVDNSDYRLKIRMLGDGTTTTIKATAQETAKLIHNL